MSSGHVWIGAPLFALAGVLAVLGAGFLPAEHRRVPHRRSVAVMALVSAAFCVATGTEYLLAGAGWDYALAYRFTWVGWLTLPAVFTFMFHVAARPRWARLAGAVLYPFWTVVLVLAVVTDLVDVPPQRLVPFEKETAPLETALRLFGAGLVVVALVFGTRLRRALTGLRRAQINYFYVGLAIYGLLAALTAVLLPVTQLGAFDPALTCIFAVPWVLLAWRASGKYHLIDAKLVVARLLTGFVLLVLGTVAFVALFLALRGVTSPLWAGIIAHVATGAAFLFTPVFSLALRLITAGIVRHTFDYRGALESAAQAVVSHLDLPELLDFIVRIAERTLAPSAIQLFLPDAEGRFVDRAGAGPDGETGKPSQLDAPLIDWLTQRQDLFVRDEQELTQTPAAFARLTDGLDDAVALALPLAYRGELRGVLALGEKSSGDPYGQEDLVLLRALASQAAIAIENARLFEVGMTDGLTGLYHRRYVVARLHEELARVRRHGGSLSTLVLDIDHFKQVNDSYGHIPADRVLVEVGKRMRASTREDDVVGRFGGDEFVVVLPDTDGDAALIVGERLRVAVLDSAEATGIPITISVGVASCGQEDVPETPEAFIALADQALYEAKSQGRNRTEVQLRGGPVALAT